MDALRPKSLSERLGAQAEDYIHGRQVYWESDEADPHASLIHNADREAQKAHEVEHDFVQGAKDIGDLVEQVRRIPDQVRDYALLSRLEVLGKEVDPQVLLTLREATKALEDAVRPLLKILEDRKGGIAGLMRSCHMANYDHSPLKPVIDEMGEARKHDEELTRESRDYKATRALKDSPQVWNRYRAHLKEDPSRRRIYFIYLLDLLTQFAEALNRFTDLHQLDTLFHQLSKNYLHWISDAIALPYGTELDTRTVDTRYIRQQEITEAEHAALVLKMVRDFMLVLQITRTLRQIVGSIHIKPSSLPSI